MTHDEARKSGKRVYWEESTGTIRSCPENYCIAARLRTSNGYTWATHIDGALAPKWEHIAIVLGAYERGSTAQALADLIAEKVFAAEVRS